MPVSFRISDWYWIVGGDANNVWSSAKCASVPVGDPDYVAWLAIQGHYPSIAATMTDVESSCAVAFPRGTPRTYAAASRYNKASGGCFVTSVGGNVAFLTDPVARNTINSAYDFMEVKGAGYTIHWKMSNGSFISMNLTQITTVMNDMAGFVQSCFTAENNLQASINAGTVTLADIDAAFAAISNVFP